LISVLILIASALMLLTSDSSLLISVLTQLWNLRTFRARVVDSFAMRIIGATHALSRHEVGSG